MEPDAPPIHSTNVSFAQSATGRTTPHYADAPISSVSMLTISTQNVPDSETVRESDLLPPGATANSSAVHDRGASSPSHVVRPREMDVVADAHRREVGRREPADLSPTLQPSEETRHPSRLPQSGETKQMSPPASSSQSTPYASTTIDELLPKRAERSESGRSKESAGPTADDLLPPAAAGETEVKSARSGAPREPGGFQTSSISKTLDGSVLIPTEAGKYIALREPIKTVNVDGREVELRRLTPEEKQQLRFKRNLFLAGFGMIFLTVALMIAAYLNGAF